jgi:hypothetical protein
MLQFSSSSYGVSYHDRNGKDRCIMLHPGRIAAHWDFPDAADLSQASRPLI